MGKRIDHFFKEAVAHQEGNPDLLLSLKAQAGNAPTKVSGCCASGSGAAYSYAPKT